MRLTVILFLLMAGLAPADDFIYKERLGYRIKRQPVIPVQPNVIVFEPNNVQYIQVQVRKTAVELRDEIRRRRAEVARRQSIRRWYKYNGWRVPYLPSLEPISRYKWITVRVVKNSK